MTPEALRKLHVTIHGSTAAAAAIGAGLAPIPFAETVALLHLQATMVAAIGRIHNAEPTYAEAIQLVLSIGGSAVHRVVAKRLLLAIPNRVPLIGAATAAATTEAVGWAAHHAFCSRPRYSDADASHARERSL